jgi:hypothetical protein
VDFFLFLLVNATLFIRPAEVVPALIGLPIYNVLIVACLVVSFGSVLGQLNGRSLHENPLTACVVGLLLAVMLSHLAHAQLRLAWDSAGEFAKVVLYYLLLVAILDSPTRLSRFLTCLVLFTLVLTALALIQYHGLADIPAIEVLQRREIDEETGTVMILPQLQSTGIYNDPNDLCLILLVGMGICLYRLGDRRSGLFRAVWLAPFGLFLYALVLTRSRGGFLALLAAVVALFQARFGWRKAIPLVLVALPVAFVIFAGRQTNIDPNEESAQSRIQLWAEGLALLRQSPLFGIGQNQYVEETLLVAHNSFVHGFTELGLFGGTLFLGAFHYALTTLYRLDIRPGGSADPELARLRPYLLAIIVAYSTGMLTLSRTYIVPTYMVLGLVTVYLRLAAGKDAEAVPRLDHRLVGRFAAASACFLIGTKVFVTIFARWG